MAPGAGGASASLAGRIRRRSGASGIRRRGRRAGGGRVGSHTACAAGNPNWRRTSDPTVAQLLPQAIDLGPIHLAAIRIARVVECGRARPRPGVLAQTLQEPRSIGDVAGRVERLVQGCEGVGVIAEIDLHAADINVRAAARLQLPNLVQRLTFGLQVVGRRARGHGPWPSLGAPVLGQPAARLRERDGPHQPLGNALGALGLIGDRPADVGQAGADGPGWQQARCDVEGQHRQGSPERYGEPLRHPAIIATTG